MICRPAIAGNPCLRDLNMKKFLLLTVALTAATPAAAQQFQSTQLLDVIVSQFTGRPIGVLGGARTAVDPRLKLVPCAAPQLSWRTDQQDAVLVRCMNPEWRIFVPVIAPPPAPKPVVARPVPVVATPAPAPTPVVKPVAVIKRGDAITLEAGSAGFTITQEGTAMADAPVGGRLQVKIDGRVSPIQAIAIEQGRARLPGAGE